MQGQREIIMEKNLTSGSVFKNMMLFSLPYLLSYFLQTLYGMADLFIIGQFEGVASTTAVSVGSQVMHMLTVILVGLAMGTTVAVGQAVGAGDRKKASLSIGNTVTLFLGVSVALTAVLLLCVRPIVGIISTPEEAVEGTIRYLTICFIGIPFITAYNIISSIFRGLGDSKSPMYFIAIACVANIVLDYVFMGVFHIGPAGAALGTIISQTISVITALVAMGKKKIGIQVAFIIITIIANRRGLSDAAAVGIVEKIISFVFLVPSSMLSTVSALCAQNIGAGKHDRAAKTLQYAIMITVGFGIAVSVLVQFFAEPVVGLFTTDQLVRIPGVYLMSKLFADTLYPMGLATACGSLLSVVICVAVYHYLKSRFRW